MSWEWYRDSSMVHLFIHMLLKANRETQQWRGITIERGQFVSGRRALSAEIGISEQTTRTCIRRLKSTNELTSQNTNKYTIFTLKNYELYQSVESANQQTNHQSTSSQPSANQQLTTNKKVKKLKKDKKEKKEKKTNTVFVPPTLEEVKAYIADNPQYRNVDPGDFWKGYHDGGWIDTRGNPVRNWKLKLITRSKHLPDAEPSDMPETYRQPTEEELEYIENYERTQQQRGS
jgi:hypothetical protein